MRNILRNFDRGINKTSELKMSLADKHMDNENLVQKNSDLERQLDEVKEDVSDWGENVGQFIKNF